jgi:hypothetical protein
MSRAYKKGFASRKAASPLSLAWLKFSDEEAEASTVLIKANLSMPLAAALSKGVGLSSIADAAVSFSSQQPLKACPQ